MSYIIEQNMKGGCNANVMQGFPGLISKQANNRIIPLSVSQIEIH